MPDVFVRLRECGEVDGVPVPADGRVRLTPVRVVDPTVVGDYSGAAATVSWGEVVEDEPDEVVGDDVEYVEPLTDAEIHGPSFVRSEGIGVESAEDEAALLRDRLDEED